MGRKKLIFCSAVHADLFGDSKTYPALVKVCNHMGIMGGFCCQCICESNIRGNIDSIYFQGDLNDKLLGFSCSCSTDCIIFRTKIIRLQVGLWIHTMVECSTRHQ